MSCNNENKNTNVNINACEESKNENENDKCNNNVNMNKLNNNNKTNCQSTTGKSGKHQDRRGKHDEEDSDDEEDGDEVPHAYNPIDDKEWDSDDNDDSLCGGQHRGNPKIRGDGHIDSNNNSFKGINNSSPHSNTRELNYYSDSDKSVQMYSKIGQVVIDDVDDTAQTEEKNGGNQDVIEPTEVTGSQEPTKISSKSCITRYFSSTTTTFQHKQKVRDTKGSNSSELPNAMAKLSSSMEQLERLLQLQSMLGNISSDAESSCFSRHAKQSGSPYKKRKRGQRKKIEIQIPDDDSSSSQSTTSSIDTTFDLEDSVASLEIISEVSNSYDGNSCKTTTLTNNGNASINDDEDADIPQLIDILAAPSTSIPTTHDSSKASAIGGSMEIMKEEDTIRISECNPNGIRSNQLKSQLQHSLDLDIDIQCFSEVNADVLQPQVKQKFYEYPRSMDKSMQLV